MAERFKFTLDNGNNFYIRRYDPFLGLKILGDVQKKFLGPFAMLIDIANDQTLNDETRKNKLIEALQTVSMQLDGDSLISLAKTVLNPEYISVEVGNGPADKLDEAMLNRSVDGVFDVIQLVWQVLRYNYEQIFTQGRNLTGMGLGQKAVH